MAKHGYCICLPVRLPNFRGWCSFIRNGAHGATCRRAPAAPCAAVDTQDDPRRTTVNHRIHITNTDQTIDCPPGTTILAAAVEAGIDFPYGCASGNCGLCMCKVNGGSVDLLPYADGALGPAQESRGMTLACRALPRAHLEVSWLARPNFD
ncbi:MAG: hypothetical protein EBS99_10065 [Betaproteobacteria bacterium]|nr:hypothetical protein [Betaproteobacteria bacterium]